MDYNKDLLIENAFQAALKSYSPYSNFRVGSSLLTKSGNIYTGTNIENRSYSATICAERVALFKAISEGEKDFSAIVVVGLDYDEVLPPCGVCRQVISEFSKDIDVIMVNKDKTKILTKKISELYPYDSLEELRK